MEPAKTTRNKTGYANITFDAPRNKYRVEIRRKGVSMSARADTLEDALDVREKWLLDHPRVAPVSHEEPVFSIVHGDFIVRFD